MTNEISNNENKTVLWHFQVRKASGSQSNTRNRFLEKFNIDYIFLKIFFYRSKLLVAKVAKKNFCSKKIATKSKTGVETTKNFFLSWNFGYLLFFDWQMPCQNLSEIGDLHFTYVKIYMESPNNNRKNEKKILFHDY